jgi:hypothetical protein
MSPSRDCVECVGRPSLPSRAAGELDSTAVRDAAIRLGGAGGLPLVVTVK